MTTVFTRETTAPGASNQGAPLTNAQLDANFINLNNDKAPLNGAGTSGTWSINVSGSSKRVATTLTTKPVADLPITWDEGISVRLADNVAGFPAGVHSGIITSRPYAVGYGTLQLNHAYNSNVAGIWYRQSITSAGNWTVWRKLVDSVDIGTYSPSLTGAGASGNWGISVTGNAATASKLATPRTINGVNFDGTANISVPVGWSDVTGKPAVIAAGTDAAAARAAIGAASLVGGKIPEHELPAVAITDVFPVASEAAMLALTAEKGDIAIRSDLNKCFALSAAPASTLANWLELKTPANAVLSVAGKTGVVTLVKTDIVDLENVDNTSDANKPVSTAQQNALNLKANLASPTFTGTPTAPTAAVGTNTTQLATTAYVVAERAATATLTNKTLTAPVLTGTREVRVAMPANAIDLSAGNVFIKTISGATTLTVSNTPTTGITASFILELTNAGSASITWFSGVKWAGGTAPTLTAAGVDVLGFYSHDGGTTWRGMVLAKDSK